MILPTPTNALSERERGKKNTFFLRFCSLRQSSIKNCTTANVFKYLQLNPLVPSSLSYHCSVKFKTNQDLLPK